MSIPNAAFQEPGIAPSVLKLLRLRLTILINGFRRAKTGVKIGYIVIGVAILAVIGFVLFASIALLGFLHSPLLAQHLGNVMPLLESIPSVIFTVATIGILLASFSVLLHVLYLSGDMDFLMSAPVPIRAVFVAKLVQAILPNFGILCLLILPLLFGFGISSGYHFLYYPAVVLVLAVISLVAASLASLLVLFIVRIFPARRVAEVLGFVVGMTFFILSQSSRFAHFDFDKVSDSQMAGLSGMAQHLNQPWSPPAWAGRGVVDLGKGEWVSALGLLAATMILGGLVFYVALFTSERLYYTGWASLKDSRRKSKKRVRSGSSAAAERTGAFRKLNLIRRLIPVPVLAVLVKDLRLFRRDLASLSSLLFPMILGVVYAISLLRSGGKLPEGRGEAPRALMELGNAMMNYMDVALVLFLGGMLVSNLSGLSFSREGKNYWLLKAAPIHTNQLLAAKFLVGYLPSVLICSIYLVVLEILRHAIPLSTIFSLIGIWVVMAGLTGISLALGIQGAKFDWENPSQIHRTIGCIGQLIGMMFLLACFLLLAAPAVLAGLFRFPAVVGLLAGLLLCSAASALAVIIPLSLVRGRVSTLAEE